MGIKPYVEVDYDEGDRSASGFGYYLQIVVGKRRFTEDSETRTDYKNPARANEAARQLASRLGIEAKLYGDT